MIGTIHNLSKHEHIFKYEWRDLNAFNCLLTMANKFNELPELNVRLLAYFSIINLHKKNLNGDVLVKLNDLSSVINDVIDLIDACSKLIAINDEKLIRKSFKLNSFSEYLTEITIICSKDTEWRLTELIMFLINVCSTNNDTKYGIYENFAMKNSLKMILFNGNVVEKEYALLLLWKLTLEPRVAKLVKLDISLYSFLVGLSLNKHIRDKSILKYSNLILYLVDNNDNNHNIHHTLNMNNIKIDDSFNFNDPDTSIRL
jgi:hypothetical protein